MAWLLVARQPTRRDAWWTWQRKLCVARCRGRRWCLIFSEERHICVYKALGDRPLSLELLLPIAQPAFHDLLP